MNVILKGSTTNWIVRIGLALSVAAIFALSSPAMAQVTSDADYYGTSEDYGLVDEDIFFDDPWYDAGDFWSEPDWEYGYYDDNNYGYGYYGDRGLYDDYGYGYDDFDYGYDYYDDTWYDNYWNYDVGNYGYDDGNGLFGDGLFD